MSEREAIYVPGLSRHLVVMPKVITFSPLESSPPLPFPSLPANEMISVPFCDLLKGSRGIEFIFFSPFHT